MRHQQVHEHEHELEHELEEEHIGTVLFADALCVSLSSSALQSVNKLSHDRIQWILQRLRLLSPLSDDGREFTRPIQIWIFEYMFVMSNDIIEWIEWELTLCRYVGERDV